MSKPARCSEQGRLSRHSFPLTWGDLGLHSRLCSRSPQYMSLCEMSSWPHWVAWRQGPVPSNGEPQLLHLGHSGQGCSLLPHEVEYAEDFFCPYGFYWIMTWNLCKEHSVLSEKMATKPTQDADSQERHSIFCMFPTAKMSSSLILINSAMKRFLWCTARTKWLIQTGLRQREQSSLLRRSWLLIKAALRDEAGAADHRGGELSLPQLCWYSRCKDTGILPFLVFPSLQRCWQMGSCEHALLCMRVSLADNWKGEFELVDLPGLFWGDLWAHSFCRSPQWWWAVADHQWAAPRKDYGIFSVLSRPNRGHWSKPFTAHSGEIERTSSSCDCVKLQS